MNPAALLPAWAWFSWACEFLDCCVSVIWPSQLAPLLSEVFYDTVLSDVWSLKISKIVGPKLSLAIDARASGLTPGREEGNAPCSTQVSCIQFRHFQID